MAGCSLKYGDDLFCVIRPIDGFSYYVSNQIGMLLNGPEQDFDYRCVLIAAKSCHVSPENRRQCMADMHTGIISDSKPSCIMCMNCSEGSEDSVNSKSQVEL